MFAWIERLVPAVTIFLATVLVALPWGMAATNRFFLPLLPLIVIHYWTMRRPDRVSEWWAFVAGLCLDILTHGPIGFWALMYLLAYACAQMTRDMAGDGQLAKFVLASITVFALTAFAWAASSLYYFELADWRPYLTAAVAAALIYPAVGIVLRGLDLSRARDRNVLLKRGV